MTETDIRAAYLEELVRVAPDIDPAEVSDHDHLQDGLALDSMDILTLVTALHERLGVDIPEADYPRSASLAAALEKRGKAWRSPRRQVRGADAPRTRAAIDVATGLGPSAPRRGFRQGEGLHRP